MEANRRQVEPLEEMELQRAKERMPDIKAQVARQAVRGKLVANAQADQVVDRVPAVFVAAMGLPIFNRFWPACPPCSSLN